ncbi:MAG: DUF4397 domain-containing protein [Myxococcota bacterium]|nr:DUF4397 domain-containing protein [Myxococcota bacterium]
MRGSIAIFALCATFLSACGGDTDDGLDDTALRAQVRVVQAVVDAPALDVYVLASARLPAFPNLASGSATGYVGLDTGNYQFIVRQPGDPDILAQLDVGLDISARTLLIVSGARTPGPGEQPISIKAFDDARVDPPPGKTQLRIVNATVEGESFPIGVADQALVSPPANEEVLTTVDAGVPVQITADAKAFTTPPLPPATDVTIVVIGSRGSDDGDVRALRLLNVPAVGISNTTPATTIAQNPFAVFVNGVPGGAGLLTIDGVDQPTLLFSGVSPRVQVSSNPSIRLDGEPATLGGALDPATTYLVVIAPNTAAGGITLFAYRDTLADSAETRIRAINATIGSGSRDIALSPAPVLGSDLVVGAASPSSGTLIADPAAVTAITATPLVGAPFVYTTGIPATSRYVVLVGNTATTFGAVVISADWSATFVAAD